MEFLSLSWEELHSEIYRLSKRIVLSPGAPDLIVAIARGGMTPAHILSDFLHLPVATFTVSSYKDMQQNELSNISFQVGGLLHEKNVLLVDDISDTGKTFVRGIAHLKEMGASRIKTASVFTKPWTTHLPDFSNSQTNKWIIFPYEVRETVEAISKLMTKEHKTREEIVAKLKENKVSSEFISAFLKL